MDKIDVITKKVDVLFNGQILHGSAWYYGIFAKYVQNPSGGFLTVSSFA